MSKTISRSQTNLLQDVIINEKLSARPVNRITIHDDMNRPLQSR